MNIIELVKAEVRKISPNSEIILFGSRARGDHRDDSDWDFLIILKKEKVSKVEKNLIREKLYEIELESDEIISSIIHSAIEWKKRSITPIYKVIKEEGKRA